MNVNAIVFIENPCPNDQTRFWRYRPELQPYINRVGIVRDSTQSACLVKFYDGKTFWIEDWRSQPANLRDIIREANFKIENNIEVTV